MKKNLCLLVGLCSLVALNSCKSKESAWVQAYNKASQNASTNNSAVEEIVEVAPTTPRQTTPVAKKEYQEVHDADVRTINGDVSVISGEPLKTYSVVVGSFTLESNAQGLKSTLLQTGHAARVVKTNETINGHTGWYRVVADSYNDKASAAQAKNSLKNQYPGAWLLYTK